MQYADIYKIPRARHRRYCDVAGSINERSLGFVCGRNITWDAEGLGAGGSGQSNRLLVLGQGRARRQGVVAGVRLGSAQDGADRLPGQLFTCCTRASSPWLQWAFFLGLHSHGMGCPVI